MKSFSILSLYHQNFVNQLGETLPTPQNHSNHTRNHVQSKPIDFSLVDREANDTEVNIDNPNDDVLRAITVSIQSTPTVIPKTMLFLPLREISSAEQTLRSNDDCTMFRRAITCFPEVH